MSQENESPQPSQIKKSLKTFAGRVDRFADQLEENKTQSDRVQNVNLLGDYFDGWNDLIDGKSSEADKVRQSVGNQLEARRIPDTTL